MKIGNTRQDIVVVNFIFNTSVKHLFLVVFDFSGIRAPKYKSANIFFFLI